MQQGGSRRAARGDHGHPGGAGGGAAGWGSTLSSLLLHHSRCATAGVGGWGGGLVHCLPLHLALLAAFLTNAATLQNCGTSGASQLTVAGTVDYLAPVRQAGRAASAVPPPLAISPAHTASLAGCPWAPCPPLGLGRGLPEQCNPPRTVLPLSDLLPPWAAPHGHPPVSALPPPCLQLRQVLQVGQPASGPCLN